MLDTINQYLNLTVQSIDIAHRLGPYKMERNRQVLIRFVHSKVKHMIMKKSSWLKGTNIYIFENLTQFRDVQGFGLQQKKSQDEVDETWYGNLGVVQCKNSFTKTNKHGSICLC